MRRNRSAAIDDEYLSAWARAAAAAGDSETKLIAQIALGETVDLSAAAGWNCGAHVLRRLRRYTALGARRIAATWGSPWPSPEEE